LLRKEDKIKAVSLKEKRKEKKKGIRRDREKK